MINTKFKKMHYQLPKKFDIKNILPLYVDLYEKAIKKFERKKEIIERSNKY
jgi:hypothetical protein